MAGDELPCADVGCVESGSLCSFFESAREPELLRDGRGSPRSRVSVRPFESSDRSGLERPVLSAATPSGGWYLRGGELGIAEDFANSLAPSVF